MSAMDLNLLLLFSCTFVGLVYAGLFTKVNSTSESKNLFISCKTNGSVIAFINVTSGLNENEECVGKTPQLLAQYLNCFWKEECFIDFPIDGIILLEKDSESCFDVIGKPPDYLILDGVKCFMNKTKPNSTVIEQGIIQICDEYSTGNLSMNSGLLISHMEYPWNYDPDTIVEPSKAKLKCQKALWLPMDKPQLSVGVLDFDIAEGDTLTAKLISSDQKSNHPMMTKALTAQHDILFLNEVNVKSVEFTFEIAQGSNAGRGFVLCFIMNAESETSRDACETVMNEQVQVVTREACSPSAYYCPSKKGKAGKNSAKAEQKKEKRRRKKKKKGERKKKKKGERKKKKKKNKRTKEERQQRRNTRRSGRQRNTSKQI